MLLYVCQLNNISNTLTERESERERECKKNDPVEKSCSFKRNSFCYLLFSNIQTTLSSFEFSTITWIKTTKERTWRALLKCEIHFIFILLRVNVNESERGWRGAGKESQRVCINKMPAFENESLHSTSHWITLNKSSRLEFIGEKNRRKNLLRSPQQDYVE